MTCAEAYQLIGWNILAITGVKLFAKRDPEGYNSNNLIFCPWLASTDRDFICMMLTEKSRAMGGEKSKKSNRSNLQGLFIILHAYYTVKDKIYQWNFIADVF